MISKELLSEVIETDDPYFESSDGRELIFWSGGFYRKDRETERINIYELAHKCKEWALSNGYFILSAVDGYLIVEDTKDNYKQVYRNSTSKEIPEYIAIFKACEWILEQKRIDDES